VLFSEPKIPQSNVLGYSRPARSRFSALQRAENSSIVLEMPYVLSVELFQCSSASRKFLNASGRAPACESWRVSVLFSEPKIPQSDVRIRNRDLMASFSALQRAENSSIPLTRSRHTGWSLGSFSALQRAENSSMLRNLMYMRDALERFSALQRAENSSMVALPTRLVERVRFQCSSASRKFLNPDPRTCVHPYFRPR